MRILKNRVVISLMLIVLATYFWEFWIKPVTGPIYTEAVREYKNRNYPRSLRLLQQAHGVDPNDTAILALMGWNYLKLGDPKTAEEPYFRRAHDLSPHVVDITLGYAYAEIELGKHEQARRLLDQLQQAGVDSADMHVAEGAYYRRRAITARRRASSRPHCSARNTTWWPSRICKSFSTPPMFAT